LITTTEYPTHPITGIYNVTGKKHDDVKTETKQTNKQQQNSNSSNNNSNKSNNRKRTVLLQNRL